MINVLSLFDGISCGQVALNRANIKYKNYFASEINNDAITVVQKNYPNTIQLGDINNWKEWKLPQIDLILAGSPCQGFSFNGKQLNFNDNRSKLFFTFIDILRNIPFKYYLLENVRMRKCNEFIINSCLSNQPILINSNLVSAQNRPRLYWTNIQNIRQPKDKKLFYKDIKYITKYDKYLRDFEIDKIKNKLYIRKDHYIFTNDNKKVKCLLASHNHLAFPKDINYRLLNTIEWERLQTLPDNYTKGIKRMKRYNCIGNGWTVDVIVHILNYLKENDFKNKKRFVLKNDFNEKELLLNHFAQMKGLVF